MPYQTAATLLKELIGIQVRPMSIWHWVQSIGQRAMTQLSNPLSALAAGNRPQVEPLEPGAEELPLLIGVVRVMVGFGPKAGRPKGKTVWRQIKGGLLARLGLRETDSDPSQEGIDTPLIQRRLVAALGDIKAIGSRLWLEAIKQGVIQGKQILFISDGARGFSNLFSTDFAPVAIGILDFYHVAENLFWGAGAWLDPRTQKAKNWFAIGRQSLRDGDVEAVMTDITDALAQECLPQKTPHRLKNLYHYLKTDISDLQYPKFKALGLPIGSGMVESACKGLIIQRFKQVGIRWSEDGFNSLLHLRLAWVNDRFDQLFENEPSPN